MTNKDCLIVLLIVVGFFAVTFYLWVNHIQIARMLFAGLGCLGMGLFAFGLWHGLKGLIRE